MAWDLTILNWPWNATLSCGLCSKSSTTVSEVKSATAGFTASGRGWLVPPRNDSRITLVTQDTQGGGAESEEPAAVRRQAEPPRGKDPQDVPVTEKRYVTARAHGARD